MVKTTVSLSQPRIMKLTGETDTKHNGFYYLAAPVDDRLTRKVSQWEYYGRDYKLKGWGSSAFKDEVSCAAAMVKHDAKTYWSSAWLKATKYMPYKERKHPRTHIVHHPPRTIPVGEFIKGRLKGIYNHVDGHVEEMVTTYEIERISQKRMLACLMGYETGPTPGCLKDKRSSRRHKAPVYSRQTRGLAPKGKAAQELLISLGQPDAATKAWDMLRAMGINLNGYKKP